MDENRLIRTLRLKNFLSYGTEGEEVELKPLNVLIGPNASGKSNLIEAIGLLCATPKDLAKYIRDGGGIGEWLWKGEKSSATGEIEATVSHPKKFVPLRYRVSFTQVGQRMELMDEVIEDARPTRADKKDPYFYYRYQGGAPVINVRTLPTDAPESSEDRTERRLQREDLSPDQSVLSQRKDPDQYPELTFLGNQFARIKLYREWDLGRTSALRRPQQTDLSEDFLSENASNLALVFNNLQNQPGTKHIILESLKQFYENTEDMTTKISGGTVQLFLHERGLAESIPATRLSDGTLHYLCLLSLLCHPKPPPLLCIEEPEIGLHPDVFPALADLLMDASERTQLIVTTHSDALVSALSNSPESVLVCERDDRGTHLKRLVKEELVEWLAKYTLGELWRMGEIGGTL